MARSGRARLGPRAAAGRDRMFPRRRSGAPLGEGQFEGREEPFLLDAPPPIIGPEWHPDLIVDQVEIAVHRPPGHPDRNGDLLRSRPAFAAFLEVAEDAIEARGTITLGGRT